MRNPLRGRVLECVAAACTFTLAVGACDAAVCASPAYAASQNFGSEGSGAGQFSEPRGVAVDQETNALYIADRNNHRIDKFASEGEFLLAWGWGVADGKTEAPQTCSAVCVAGLEGSGAGELKEVEGIAVDNSTSLSHHDVYVEDTANHRIQKFGPEGEFILMFGGEVNSATTGDVCLASEAASCKAGVEGAGPGEFKGLTGRAIAVDSTGTVYVGDENRVQEFSEAGVPVGEIALPGIGLIENLAVDSTKDIYVKGSEKAGVRKFDGTGTELGSPRDEAGQGERQAIAIGPADELFVNDFQGESHHILTYDSAGTLIASFDPGSFGQDAFKHGIAYSITLKALYVVNEAAVRIVAPPPSGPYILPETEKASEIAPTSAKLEATINPEGGAETKYHFEYGATTAYGTGTPEVELTGGAFEEQAASAAISGLEPRATYHFRVVAENAAHEVSDGPDQTFTTLPPVTIVTTSASQVDATSARLEAELNPHGLASEYRFEYGTSTAYGTSIPVPDGSVGSGTSTTTVRNLIQELLPSTTYHYRVIAHNGLGVVIGPDRSFRTQGPASILADGRTWEQVSPPNKHGAPLEPLTEEGGILQAAAGGGAFAYVALGPINTEPKGVRSPSDSQILATRSSSGWSSEDITTPHEEISLIHASVPSEYKFFAEDLSSGVVEPEGVTPLSPQSTERTPYRREEDGQFVPLVTAGNVLSDVKFGGEEFPAGSGVWRSGTEFRTATPDGSHVVLKSPQILAPGFKAGFEANGKPNLYELSGGDLTLVSILPSGEASSEAGLAVGVGRNDLNMRGAISSDGSRVVFGAEHLYVRDVALGQTLQLDEAQAGAAGGESKAVFQAANSDDSRIFFTDPARLTTDSTAQPEKPDLYLCEVHEASPGHLACTLSDLSVDHNKGEAANVNGGLNLGEVSAIDEAGNHVYFTANGVLTNTSNAEGEHAVPGICNSAGEAACNLYEYDTQTSQISLVAVLSSEDDPDWAGRTNLAVLGNLTARSSPDGHYFTFMSRRSLTGYDNRDVNSNQPDEEVFQYDTESGALRCVSCNPTGARPEGVFDKEGFPGLLIDHANTWGAKNTDLRWLAGSIPGWTLGPSHNVALYQSRYLSNSGREFFNSADALVPQDTNHVEDVYEYEPPGVGDCTTASSAYSSASAGCINLISSGTAKEESAFLDASASGGEAFFLTQARLASTDVDSAFDVYDAHVCSSSSPCPPPPAEPSQACQGDSCQNPSTPPPEEPSSSSAYKGPGNAAPPPAAAPAAKPTPKPLSRAELLAKALKSCKAKEQKKKRLACERQARSKYGPKPKPKAKKSSHGKRTRGESRR